MAPENSPIHPFTHSPSPLAIFGAGGLGREVRVLIEQINAARPQWALLGFYDDAPPADPARLGLPYLGTGADLNATATPLAVAVAVGNPAARAAVVARLGSGQLSFPTLCHPGVALAGYQHLHIGAGCLIQQGCILTTHVTLGRFVLLNLGCTVGHDATLEDFASLMPHANVGGAARVGAGAYLGTNATVLPGVAVGTGAVVGAGAVVVRAVAAGATVVGVPARQK